MTKKRDNGKEKKDHRLPKIPWRRWFRFPFHFRFRFRFLYYILSLSLPFFNLSFQPFSNTSTPSITNISWMILFNLLTVVTSTRYEKPIHYILKIQSFSLLKEAVASSPCQRFESQKFYAGGSEWYSYSFLCFYIVIDRMACNPSFLDPHIGMMIGIFLFVIVGS